MAKRSIAAILILAALLLVPSCDAESFLRGFGTNVLGGLDSEKTVNEINEMVESGITDEDSYNELVKLVVQASKNPDTEKKLIDTLSQKASETSVQSIQSDVTQINNELGNVDISGLPAGIQAEAQKAIDAVDKIATGEDGYEVTKGDVAIIQAAKSIVDMIQESGIADGSSPSDEEIQDLIGTANEALRMFNTLKPSTAFKDIDLNAVIDELVASAGGETTEPEEGAEV